MLRILGSRIDEVSFPEAVARIREFLFEPRAHHVITGNTLMLLDAETDPQLQAILEKADLVVPESSGVYWASRRLGQPLKEFIPGIDLLLALCKVAVELKQPIYLLGAKEGVAQAAAKTLAANFSGLTIGGAAHGYFTAAETPVVLERIAACRPAFLFVGMSVPGQEKWIAQHLQNTSAGVVMGVGGSFDVLAGRLRRAPAWMRVLGIEWLYRLIQEPWRWRRIARLPIFAFKVIFTSK